MQARDRLSSTDLCISFPPVSIPVPGRYEFQIWANSMFLGSTFIDATAAKVRRVSPNTAYSVISVRSGDTIKAGVRLLLHGAASQSGATSFSTKPSSPTSSTAMSVTIRPTHSRPVQRIGALSDDLGGAAPVRVLHGHDHAPRARHQVHRPADVADAALRQHPVGEVAPLRHLQRAEHRHVDVAAADHPECVRRAEEGHTGCGARNCPPALIRSTSSSPGSAIGP